MTSSSIDELGHTHSQSQDMQPWVVQLDVPASPCCPSVYLSLISQMLSDRERERDEHEVGEGCVAYIRDAQS